MEKFMHWLGPLTVSGVEVSEGGFGDRLAFRPRVAFQAELLEKEIPSSFAESEHIVLNNHLNDFTTASAHRGGVNGAFGDKHSSTGWYTVAV